MFDISCYSSHFWLEFSACEFIYKIFSDLFSVPSNPHSTLLRRAYKELMAKCNVLGRGEATYHRKLEKANKKIHNLKVSGIQSS